MVQQNPYKHLDPFEELDSPTFFGREEERLAVAGQVLRTRVNLLYGEAGAGKTSFINAGIIASMVNREDIFVIETDCAPNLLKRFLHNLNALLDDNWQRWLKQGSSSTWANMMEFLSAFTVERECAVVLIFDNLEAMFESGFPEAERHAFFNEFIAEIEVGSESIHFLGCCRTEALDNLQIYRNRTPNLFRNNYSLQRIGRRALVMAVEEPLKAIEYPFDAGLGTMVYEDLKTLANAKAHVSGEPYLPDMQLVCHEMFRLAQEEQAPLTHDFFRALGGARGLIDSYFQRIFATGAGRRKHVAEELLTCFAGETGGRTLSKVKILWIFSASKEDEKELERFLDAWVAEKFLVYDAAEDGYRLRHDCLVNGVNARLGLRALLNRRAHQLDILGQRGVYDVSLHRLEPFFRYRKVLDWTPERLEVVIFCAMKEGFPANWWSTLLSRKIGDTSFRELLVRGFQNVNDAGFRTGVAGILAQQPITNFAPAALRKFTSLALRLVSSRQQPLELRHAVMGLCEAWKLTPTAKLYSLFLFEEDDTDLRLGFLDWLLCLESWETEPLIKKWHALVDDTRGDLNRYFYLEKLTALLGLFENGVEALWEHRALLETADAPFQLHLDLAVLHHADDLAPEHLVPWCMKAWDEVVGRAGFDENVKAELLNFLNERASKELFPELWSRIQVQHPIAEDTLNLAAQLLSEKHYPLMMDSLIEDDELVRRNAMDLVLAAGPQPELLAEAPGDQDFLPWEARAILLRCHLAKGAEAEVPKSFSMSPDLANDSDVIWAAEYLHAFFDAREAAPEWLDMFRAFEDQLETCNMVLIPEFTLEPQQKWAAKVFKSRSWNRRYGDILKQSAVLFGENAQSEIRRRLNHLKALLHKWENTARSVYGGLDQTRAVTMRLILKNLGNVLKKLDAKQSDFEEYSRRIDLAPLASRNLREFIEEELCVFWEAQTQNLEFLKSRLESSDGGDDGGEEWRGCVREFVKLVSHSREDLQFWRDCLPQLKDREVLESLHLNHRCFLEVRQSLLAALAGRGAGKPWVKDFVMGWFRKSRTEFNVAEWRLVISCLAASTDDDLAANLNLALKTHKGLEPELLRALQTMDRFHLVPDDTLEAILGNSRESVRIATLEIVGESRPALIRENLQSLFQTGEKETIFLVLSQLERNGREEDLQVLLSNRRLLSGAYWERVKITMEAIINRSVAEDKRWYETGGLKSLI